jgi:hypothetical protein
MQSRASAGRAFSPAHEFFHVVASCGLLPGPAHEFFGSRKLRLAPQGYSPWTPPMDRLGLITLYPRPLAASSRPRYPSQDSAWLPRADQLTVRKRLTGFKRSLSS